MGGRHRQRRRPDTGDHSFLRLGRVLWIGRRRRVAHDCLPVHPRNVSLLDINSVHAPKLSPCASKHGAGSPANYQWQAGRHYYPRAAFESKGAFRKDFGGEVRGRVVLDVNA